MFPECRALKRLGPVGCGFAFHFHSAACMPLATPKLSVPLLAGSIATDDDGFCGSIATDDDGFCFAHAICRRAFFVVFLASCPFLAMVAATVRFLEPLMS